MLRNLHKTTKICSACIVFVKNGNVKDSDISQSPNTPGILSLADRTSKLNFATELGEILGQEIEEGITCERNKPLDVRVLEMKTSSLDGIWSSKSELFRSFFEALTLSSR